MPKISPISPKKLLKILSGIGFSIVRIKGSHHFLQDKAWHTTVVPVHGNEDVSIGLLKKILRDIGIDGDVWESIRK